MSILRIFDKLVAAYLPEFIELGRMRYSRTAVQEQEQRRSLGVQAGGADFEILLWSTGDVEFGYGTVDDNHDEHLVVTSEAELEALIARLMNLAKEWNS